jgi:hypothetical protein
MVFWVHNAGQDVVAISIDRLPRRQRLASGNQSRNPPVLDADR